jgi:prepilin-type N-terminal cleavage/methylation domain-containing protein
MKKGFTLVELMVATVVIAIMSAVLLLSWRPAQEAFYLRQGAFQLAGDLRRTQQLSLSTQGFSCSPPEGYSGFGVYLNTGSSGSYQIFENCNNNYSWDSGEGLETISLPSGVTIDSFTPVGASLSILFIPPNPNTYIEEVASGAEAVITLTNGSSTTTITVNNSGLVEVD